MPDSRPPGRHRSHLASSASMGRCRKARGDATFRGSWFRGAKRQGCALETAAQEAAAAARRCSATQARRSLRRSSSDVPPHTPESWLVESANSRHSRFASQVSQTALAAAICSSASPVVPTGKNRSGSVSRQAESALQLSFAVFRLRLEVSATVPPCRGWDTAMAASDHWVSQVRGLLRFPARFSLNWEPCESGNKVNLPLCDSLVKE